ncbi:SPOR domain-containing protein [Oleiphilus messinensis]|nr:SPOR domain-containing protein [Oleiphilus messinensis]
MPKDYAPPMSSRNNAPATKGTRKIGYILLIIIISAAFLTGLYFLNKVPRQQSTPAAPAEITPKTAIPEKEKPKMAKAEPELKNPDESSRFEFYKMLPNSEIETSNVDAYRPKVKADKKQYNYILQTGSFRNPSDAERQKAQIGFQGLRATVSSIDDKSGRPWYRVEVGPFYSRSKMNGAIDKLVSINIQPLTKKIPKEP